MNKVFVTAIVKDVPAEEYGHYLPPMKARRMGKLQKRALVTALKAMEISGVGEPDAILNGTAMGCMENTVQMLCGLASEGEEVNMPTCFMQSTHNTVASMIAIYTKNHGYNTTYSHRTISFELALQDALLRLRTGRLRTALVCANDEREPVGMLPEELLPRYPPEGQGMHDVLVLARADVDSVRRDAPRAVVPQLQTEPLP